MSRGFLRFCGRFLDLRTGGWFLLLSGFGFGVAVDGGLGLGLVVIAA
jgi:hypothetical protein